MLPEHRKSFLHYSLTLFLLAASFKLWADDRQMFMESYQAAVNGQENDFNRHLDDLDDYPLRAYLDFAWLYYNYDRNNLKALENFLKLRQELPVSELLRSRWLYKLARHHHWQDFLSIWKDQDNDYLRCAHGRALYASGLTEQAMQKARQLWLTGKSMPDNCNSLFHNFQTSTHWDDTLYWQRFLLAAKNGQVKLARYLGTRIPVVRKKIARNWLEMIQNPDKATEKSLGWPGDSDHRQISLWGMSWLSKKKPARARHFLDTVSHHFSYSEEEKTRLKKRMALFAATDYLPEASLWIDQLAEHELDDQLIEWRARIALRESQWKDLIGLIDGMPAPLKKDEQWRYWKAIALDNTGFLSESESMLQRLADESHYYGFLAADKLNVNYNLCSELNHANVELMQKISSIQAASRALELWNTDLVAYARLEWHQAIKNMNRNFLRQAGIMAHQENWHEQAIMTLAKAGHMKLYPVRFPLAHRPEIDHAARHNQLDSEWIYAIIRAESAFASDAVSKAGAKGLMQLMPEVASQLARRERLRNWNNSRLFNPGLNIRLGSLHFKDYLERFSNRLVQALAAYNAGPDNVREWMKLSGPIQDSQWIDTIPFGATRSYIRQVLAFAIIYDWRMDRKIDRISQMLDQKTSDTTQTGLAGNDQISAQCTPLTQVADISKGAKP